MRLGHLAGAWWPGLLQVPWARVCWGDLNYFYCPGPQGRTQCGDASLSAHGVHPGSPACVSGSPKSHRGPGSCLIKRACGQSYLQSIEENTLDPAGDLTSSPQRETPWTLRARLCPRGPLWRDLDCRGLKWPQLGRGASFPGCSLHLGGISQDIPQSHWEICPQG